MPLQNVYMLERKTENPAYEGFVSKVKGQTPASLSLNWMHKLQGKQWIPQPLAATWQPVPVVGRVRKFNDFPSGNVPIFSPRAADALRDLLEPNGELLPVESSLGTYFAYNLLTTADVLDHARSKIKWTYEPTIAGGVDRFEVVPERLEGLSVFILPFLTREPLVTDVFRDRVRQHGLRGFRFIKVWPLPAGVEWTDMRKQQWRLEEAEGLPGGQTVKGNTVVIRLFLADESRESPDPHERGRIDDIVMELEALLINVSSTAPLVGSVEGTDEVKGEVRLFVTCPDADALVERLRPWLHRLRWPPRFLVLKRYGLYVDYDAPEKYVEDL